MKLKFLKNPTIDDNVTAENGDLFFTLVSEQIYDAEVVGDEVIIQSATKSGRFPLKKLSELVAMKVIVVV